MILIKETSGQGGERVLLSNTRLANTVYRARLIQNVPNYSTHAISSQFNTHLFDVEYPLLEK